MSDMKPLASIESCFGDVGDPHVRGRCDYPLMEVLTIAICAVLAGAEGWTDIETFGKSKEAWLRQFLELEHGIPSHVKPPATAISKVGKKGPSTWYKPGQVRMD